MAKCAVNTTLNENAFTLVEVVTATVVLTIGIFSLYSMQLLTITTNSSANTLTEATTWANDRIELLLNGPYDCTPFRVHCHDLDDVNGDGSNQDTTGDGIDNTLPDTQFGLGNNTTITADHHAVSPGGLYTILWNVAVDVPVPDTKTVRVIVNSQVDGVNKSVAMTYVKASR